MEPLSDEELVSKYRAQAGSPEAGCWLNELFQRHHGRVALWCLRLGGDRESAADLAQEVFLKAFRYLDTFRGDSKFSTWLYSIARNHCFNEAKSRAARPQTAGDPALIDFADLAPDVHTQLERASAAQDLRQLLETSLTGLESRVMTLHYVEELSLDTITRLLGLNNASGAKAYIVSAKRKLAREIERRKAAGQKSTP
jgi:RNA polymerase sigma-70 factor (ECF subfamily)